MVNSTDTAAAGSTTEMEEEKPDKPITGSDDYKLFSTLFQSSQPSTRSLANINSKSELLRLDGEKCRLECIDYGTLDEIIKCVDSEPFKKSTLFLNSDTEVFRYSRLVKPVEEKWRNLENLSPEQIAEHGSAFGSFTVDDFVTMTEEQELDALQTLHHYLGPSFDYSTLKPSAVECLLYSANKSGSTIRELKAKLAKTRRYLLRKSNGRWSLFKQRLRIYHHYFFNKMFNSANCLITCWVFCFCSSLFH